MAIGKSKRFELFKRDGFACQYCGRKPPEVVLELDHINPSSKGGTNDEINLITSCFDCNRGKRDKKLGDVHPRPDADLKFLEVQQEIAEAKRYLESSAELEKVRALIIEQLRSVWVRYFHADYEPSEYQWHRWLAEFSAQEIEYALTHTLPKFNSGQLGNPGSERAVSGAIRYASGIMHRRAEEGEDTIQ